MDGDFSNRCKAAARLLNYTEYDSEHMATTRAEVVGEVIEENLEEPCFDELCQFLNVDTSELETPAKEFSAEDVGLAAWSNWGDGSPRRAVAKSRLTEEEFIILNDHFRNLYEKSD